MGAHRRTEPKAMISPALTGNSPIVLKFSPRIATGERSRAMSGPAIADKVVASARVTQGMVDPYPNRRISSLRNETDPRSPVTIRIKCEFLLAPRHEIGQHRHSVTGLEACFQYECILSIAARCANASRYAERPANGRALECQAKRQSRRRN